LKQLISIFLFLFISSFAISQSDNSKVVLIGEDEKAYEAAMIACPTLLLQVTNNSMDKAYSIWTEMFSQLEKEALEDGVDLKGAKVWINLFWEADGSIKSIAYYPKPNSKNMDFSLLTQSLEKFANNYTLPITNDVCFSHYGSASFPVFTKLAVNNEK